MICSLGKVGLAQKQTKGEVLEGSKILNLWISFIDASYKASLVIVSW